ncbi:zinc ribbon domain-containing protein [Candidatus Dojkabacteria bacterium]|nr:zinc ribbon domain-containing protein [Candidatus Dojkabacteria bacterium]
MKYKFRCTKCGLESEFEMSIGEYENFSAKCEECGSKMDRIFESPNIKSSAGGGDGESSDGSSGYSCTGSCSSCSLCG